MKNQLIRLVNRVKYKIQAWAARAICLSGIHTKPRWKQVGSAHNASYYGECRNCTKRLSNNYKYNEGPLLDGIGIDDCNLRTCTDEHIKVRHGHREIEPIIKACINMFLKDQPTNV